MNAKNKKLGNLTIDVNKQTNNTFSTSTPQSLDNTLNNSRK